MEVWLLVLQGENSAEASLSGYFVDYLATAYFSRCKGVDIVISKFVLWGLRCKEFQGYDSKTFMHSWNAVEIEF